MKHDTNDVSPNIAHYTYKDNGSPVEITHVDTDKLPGFYIKQKEGETFKV